MGTEAKEAQDGPLPLAVALIILAGFVDAVSFVHFGGLFVSFMSGNSTQIAALPSLGRLPQALAALGAVVLFVMGVFSGRLMGQALGVWARAALLAVVSGLLLLAALVLGLPGLGAPPALGGAAMALAMGVLNGVLNRSGGTSTPVTYVTGTLVGLGRELADAVGGQPSRWGVHLLLWLGLVSGAALGALSFQRLGPLSLLLPAAAAALFAIGAGGLVRRSSIRSSP